MIRIAEEIKRKYRNRVLHVRLKAGIKTQKELAKLTGIRPSILCEIESNKAFLSTPYALRIKEALTCSLDDLFETRV